MAADLAVGFRAGVGTSRVAQALRPDDVVSRFDAPLAEAVAPAAEVIERLAQDAADGLHGHPSARFFGYVCGGSMPVGVAADHLVSAWGQNSPSSWHSPAVAALEQTMSRWCLELLCLPPESGVGVVTGATAANTQAIMADRHGLLKRRGWDVEAQGLFGAPEFPVLIGADAHKAPLDRLRHAGLGADRAIRVATDDQGRMRTDALDAALAACDAPPLVVLQAGQINTGAFDPFGEIIPLVHDRGGWVHVDGAFGLWLQVVPELREMLDGVEQADSWAVDLHKWSSAPYDAGLCIVRDRAALVASMSARGAYLPTASEHWDPSDSVMALSGRARGVPSHAILQHLRKTGLRELVSRHCRLARRVAERLSREPGIEVLNEVVSNQVILACRSDARTEALLAEVQRRGRVYPSHGEWRGRKVIRVSVINYAVQEEDVDLLVEEIISARRGIA